MTNRRQEGEGGRPRDPRVDDAIIQATRDVLATGGYARLTVDAVAARAGVGKAAIYRRYVTKQEMIFSATVGDARSESFPDAGSLSADLTLLCQRIAHKLSATTSDVLHGLLADLYVDPALAARFTETFLGGERLIVVEVLQRAVEREELSRVPDPAVVHALVMGPIFAWLLVLTEDPTKVHDLAHTVAQATTALLTELGTKCDQAP